MSEFASPETIQIEIVEENERTEIINLEDLPDHLIFKLPEVEYTYSCERFGVNEHLNIEYYERQFEKLFPGLLKQFPCLYYMVENRMEEANQRSPLEEIEFRKNNQ